MTSNFALESSPALLPAHTIPELLQSTVSLKGKAPALRYIPHPSQQATSSTAQVAQQEFTTITWNEYNQRARSVAKSLIALGLRPKDVGTLQGPNSREYFETNLGILLAGGISAGVYPSHDSAQSKHVVKDSQAKIAFVEDEEQLKKYQGKDCSTLKCIVVWNALKNPVNQNNYPAPVCSWEQFIDKGENVADSEVDTTMQRQKPEDPCTLVYTSGTTGNAKGVILTHDNVTWPATMAGKRFSITENDRGLSFLPLSHISAAELDFFLPIVFGQCVDIAQKDALVGSNLRTNLQRSRPTYFLAPPRIWEKFYEGIVTLAGKAPFLKRCMFKVSTTIARGIVPIYNRLCLKKNTAEGLSSLEKVVFVFLRFLLEKLEKHVFTPIKSALGLDKVHTYAVGAGSLSREVTKFFTGLNISIMQVYGMSESSGPATWPSDSCPPENSCGKAIPGTKISILNPNKKGIGEIVIQGRHVSKNGYFGNQEETRKAIDAEGRLHTGDLGKIDTDGYLHFTGRIKEMIKTSGGENIPPLVIEEKITYKLPFISHAVAVGDGKPYVTCLVTLKTQQDAHQNPTDELTPQVIEQLQAIPSSARTLSAAAQDKAVQEYILRKIKEEVNPLVGSHPRHVQKVTILPQEFAVEGGQGLITALQKLRRAKITTKYASQIDEMYRSQPTPKTNSTVGLFRRVWNTFTSVGRSSVAY
jgi:long-chain-fatty-acid--CoA ligase ACSBG